MRVLAIDLGGTNLRVALAEGPEVTPDAPPRLLLRDRAPDGLAAFRAVLSGLIAEHRPAAIGLAIPGHAQGQVCQWVPNLPWLDGVDMARVFPGLKVRLGNDAQLALLAEVAAGAARGLENAILIAIGTGIGSGLLAGGRVIRGGATSFGWACADMNAPGTPNDGWLESVAAGRALDRAARQIGLADGPALIAAARAGDVAATKALAPAIAALGTALAGAVALTGAERVIVAGGVSSALDVLGPPVLARLREHLPRHLRDTTISPAAFGRSASLAGAAIAAIGHPAWEENRT
ncbi:ROK family protein [Maritimibacter fusiformis]|uniref:ROK family protein n=1 Tax=Maritimibacter fusiformis TaxID=2603819 RepID=A0A5D0RSC3_9RHOB|nr:ROK family protein [Maritimibacter fusiformis]TYB83514.1 ROK family protein [Maritimibacter fusiformis]